MLISSEGAYVSHFIDIRTLFSGDILRPMGMLSLCTYMIYIYIYIYIYRYIYFSAPLSVCVQPVYVHQAVHDLHRGHAGPQGMCIYVYIYVSYMYIYNICVYICWTRLPQRARTVGRSPETDTHVTALHTGPILTVTDRCVMVVHETHPT
jgi:hypothetical protein